MRVEVDRVGAENSWARLLQARPKHKFGRWAATSPPSELNHLLVAHCRSSTVEMVNEIS